MPAKFKVKRYRRGGTYYLYLTAAEGRHIFEDDVDYQKWMGLWEQYVGGVVDRGDRRFQLDRPYRRERKLRMSLREEVKILAYCLTRDKVTMLVKQAEVDGITKLMKRMLTAYSMYCNRRLGKKGPVFAGVFRGTEIENEVQLAVVSRWMHRVPGNKGVRRFGWVETKAQYLPEQYPYSSLDKMIKGEYSVWLDGGEVLESYKRSGLGSGRPYLDWVLDGEVDNPDWLREIVGEI